MYDNHTCIDRFKTEIRGTIDLFFAYKKMFIGLDYKYINNK